MELGALCHCLRKQRRYYLSIFLLCIFRFFVNIVRIFTKGLFRLQDFFKEAETRNWKIKLHQFEFGKPYRDTFWKIKEEGELNIILDVKNENIFRALKHVCD